MALNGNQQKILAKVMKLLQMTVANGCTKAEADSAKQKAENLLNEYNLTQQDLELSDMVMDKFYPADENGVGYAKTPQWMKTLLGSVNRAFGCVVVWGRDEDGDIVANQSGRVSDMEVADYCYMVIRDQVFALTNEYIVQQNLRRNSSVVSSFQESLVNTVVDNLVSILGLTPSCNVSSSTGKALSIIANNEIKFEDALAYYKDKTGVNVSRQSVRLRYNSDGTEAAGRVSVSKAMNGDTTRQARIAG